MEGKLFMGRVFIPANGVVSLHDVMDQAVVIGEVGSELHHYALKARPDLEAILNSYSTIKMVLYFYKEYLTKNFGYNVLDHISTREPYRTFYAHILNRYPHLHKALSYHGHRIYGDNPVAVDLIAGTLVLSYKREEPHGN